MSSRRPLIPTVALPLASAAALALGIARLNTYMATPGSVAVAPASWPADAPFAPDGSRWTLVLAAHPRCPCTRATADQLLRTMARAGHGASLVVLCFTTSDRPDHAEPGVLSALEHLPNVRFVPDPEGDLSALFGAVTSGHLVAFDARGRTRFSGGVTPMRGMVGPATGLAVLESLLSGRTPPTASAPVYGCPLCPQTGVTAGTAPASER